MSNYIDLHARVLTTKPRLYLYRTIVILHLLPMILLADVLINMILKYESNFSLRFVFTSSIIRKKEFLVSIIATCAIIDILPLIIIALKNTRQMSLGLHKHTNIMAWLTLVIHCIITPISCLFLGYNLYQEINVFLAVLLSIL